MPAPPDLVLSSRRVVAPSGVVPASVVVSDGRIREVLPAGHPREEEAAGAAGRWLRAGDRAIMPGVVDTHVHVNEPGRGEWEGFETAGRAAAAGGVTVLVDMPLNSSPPTTRPERLEDKAAAADGRCLVDYGFWGGLVPDNHGFLRPLLEAGALGLKCFLVDSGIEEFPPVDGEVLRAGMEAVADLRAPVLVHAETPDPIEAARRESGPAARRRYATWLASRPPEAEVEGVRLCVRTAGETGCPVHVVHVSSALALRPLEAAREAGAPVTAETCPHYLAFAAEEIPDGATVFKCAPPIREEANREELWHGLEAGVLDQVSSDHSPCPPERRLPERGDFLEAWGGIASLQLLLPALWTEVRRRGHGLAAVARWLCEAPARLAGLEGRKGKIQEGYDADLVVWDPDATFVVEPDTLHHRHEPTPWLGRRLRGRVSHTFVRGRPVYEEHGFPGTAPGRWLRGRAA